MAFTGTKFVDGVEPPTHAEIRAHAIMKLMRRHPRPRYVANINPGNSDLTAVFSKLGFKHIQNTYEHIS